MKQTVAVQLFTLREFTKTTEDFERTLHRVEEMGFNTVQISAIGGDIAAQDIKRIMQDTNVSVCCTHASWDRLKNDLDTVAKEHLLFGAPIVGLSWWPESELSTKEEVEEFVRKVSEIGRKLKPYGLKFAYHNHVTEFQRYDGKTVLEMLAEATDPDEVEIIFCCCWAMVGGVDPVEYIHKLKGRITCCHYKDFYIQGRDRRVLCEVGQGNMNYPAIFKACEDTGVKYALIEQDTCQRDPFESVKMSRDYILSLGGLTERK